MEFAYKKFSILVDPIKIFLFLISFFAFIFFVNFVVFWDVGFILISFLSVFSLIFFYQDLKLLYFIFVFSMIMGDNIYGGFFNLDLDYDQMSSFFFNLTNAFGVVCIISLFLNKPFLKHFAKNFRLGIFEISLIIFISISIISTVSAGFPEQSINQLIRYFTFVCFYILTIAVLINEDILEKFVYMLSVLFISFIGLTFVKVLISGDSYFPGSIRMLLFLPFMLGVYNFYANKLSLTNQLILLAWLFLGTFSTFLSESRRTIIGIIVIWVLQLFKLRYMSLNGIIIIVAGLVILFTIIPSVIKSRLARTENAIQLLLTKGDDALEKGDTKYSIFTERDRIWESGFNLWKDNPYLGVGLMMSQQEIVKYGYTSKARMHNIYLQVLADLGILGLMSYLLIIIVLFYTLYRQIRYAKMYNMRFLMFQGYALRDFFICILIVGFFGAWGIYDNLEWFMYGYLIALYNITLSTARKMNEQKQLAIQ